MMPEVQGDEVLHLVLQAFMFGLSPQKGPKVIVDELAILESAILVGVKTTSCYLMD